jgi:hypothetical protein
VVSGGFTQFSPGGYVDKDMPLYGYSGERPGAGWQVAGAGGPLGGGVTAHVICADA